jgi:hypothetical protein
MFSCGPSRLSRELYFDEKVPELVSVAELHRNAFRKLSLQLAAAFKNRRVPSCGLHPISTITADAEAAAAKLRGEEASPTISSRKGLANALTVTMLGKGGMVVSYFIVLLLGSGSVVSFAARASVMSFVPGVPVGFGSMLTDTASFGSKSPNEQTTSPVPPSGGVVHCTGFGDLKRQSRGRTWCLAGAGG